MKEEKTFNELWNEIHKKNTERELKVDGWLMKWLPYWSKQSKILELGCGLGNNIEVLQENGFNALATDLSEVALSSIKKRFPLIETKVLDLTQPFPFEDNSFDIIIAALCLHYFSEKKTFEIMNEIKRVLKPNGKLYARVNSTQDTNHGAGLGKKLGKNFYYVEGYNKRFFDDGEVRKYFSVIGEPNFYSATMKRYDREKELYEIKVCCNK